MSSIKLFRVFGITVFMHWSWFLVAVYEIQQNQGRYPNVYWSIGEYLMLFAIVLMHEFGHALACRSVGGQADRIMLWPLGGIAFVNPPQRPGALLWSIAAGPLVNVVLLLISIPLLYVPMPVDLYRFVQTIAAINAGLLIFNMLPIYPLDGGQILQSLLWFVFGRGRSMGIATVIGLIGSLGLAWLAWWQRSPLLGVMTLFVVSRCWSGWKQGVLLRKREKHPRRDGFACPTCNRRPLVGRFWQCSNCKNRFDTFETGGVCPSCGSRFNSTVCGDCSCGAPLAEWIKSPPVPAEVAL